MGQGGRAKKRGARPKGLGITELLESHTEHQKEVLWAEVKINGKDLRALVDSRASSNFMHAEVAKRLKVETRPTGKHEQLFMADGTPATGGLLTHEATLNVHMLGGVQRIRFDILEKSKYCVILGRPWLKEYNPRINWKRMRYVRPTQKAIWTSYKNISPGTTRYHC